MKTTCLRASILALSFGVLFSGCQSGPSDKKLIATTVREWKEAFDAQDLDALMEYYSEDYTSREAPNKEAMRGFWEEAKRLGYLDRIQLSLGGSLLTITGDTAEFVFRENGEETMGFILKREENNTWRIVGDPLEITSYDQYTDPYGAACVEHQGHYRCWEIHIPEGLTGKVPLVIDLHGHSESPSHQRRVSKFDALADSEGFIVVWPYGLAQSWNSGPVCCPPANEDDLDDVGFIRKLIAKVSNRLRDRHRKNLRNWPV